jgi:hypothetical protein
MELPRSDFNPTNLLNHSTNQVLINQSLRAPSCSKNIQNRSKERFTLHFCCREKYDKLVVS